MLKYEQVVPAGVRDGAPLVVLLHGRGADRFDLLGLAPHLAPDAVVVTAEAPNSGLEWGYGGGWAWYRFLGGSAPEPESFEASQQALAHFLSELPSKTDPFEVAAIIIITLVLTFFATLFPARRAAATDPVQVLRYE